MKHIKHGCYSQRRVDCCADKRFFDFWMCRKLRNSWKLHIFLHTRGNWFRVKIVQVFIMCLTWTMTCFGCTDDVTSLSCFSVEASFQEGRVQVLDCQKNGRMTLFKAKAKNTNHGNFVNSGWFSTFMLFPQSFCWLVLMQCTTYCSLFHVFTSDVFKSSVLALDLHCPGINVD